MGYSYDSLTGRLCCDNCSNYTGVRKVRCPYNYCPAVALCPTCRANPKVKADNKKYHLEAGCKESHEQFVANENQRLSLYEQGIPVRKSALGLDDGTVKVWFESSQGEVIRIMPQEVYRAVSIMDVATLADFEKLGG